MTSTSSSNIEKIKAESVWSDEQSRWKVPDLVVQKTKLPPAGSQTLLGLFWVEREVECPDSLSAGHNVGGRGECCSHTAHNLQMGRFPSQCAQVHTVNTEIWYYGRREGGISALLVSFIMEFEPLIG